MIPQMEEATREREKAEELRRQVVRATSSQSPDSCHTSVLMYHRVLLLH
jgi:hypothetical protein